MFKNILAFVLSSVAIFGADLGVLFNSTNNNTVSPDNLVIATFVVSTNLELKYITPARALSIDNNSNVISSTLTDTQQGYLAALTGGTNLINLGAAKLIGAQGNPTNGVMSINRTLYINTASANVNDSLWINLDTNWFRIASTNGGSINETQLNFSDVTTANSSTNFHGLLPKLAGVTNYYLNSLGVWNSPLVSALGTLTDKRVTIVDLTLPGGAGLNQSTLSYNDVNNIIQLLGAGFGLNGKFAAYNISATNQITTSDLLVTNFSDVTIGDVSITAHGLAPKADGNSAHFLNGLGGWSSPAGGGAGSIASTGSPLDTYVTRWTGTNTITGTSEFTYDHQILIVPTISPTNYRVVTNSATSQVTSGTYTPTRTPISNCTTAGTTDQQQHYTRVGDEVTVTGRLKMARSGGGNFVFDVSLPIVPSGVISPTITGLAGNGTIVDSAGTFEIGPVIIFYNGNNPAQARFQTAGSSTSGTIREFWYSFVYTTN